MPPINITLHTSPSHASPTKRIHPLSAPLKLAFSHRSSQSRTKGQGHKARPMLYYTTSESSHAVPPPTVAIRPTGPSPTPSSSGSSTSQPAVSHRTKPRPRPQHDLVGATLVPQLRPIVDRCYAPTPSPGAGATGTGKSGQPGLRIAHGLPYDPISDLGNDRSAVPSPKEILRMQRLEEQKIEAKKASAAAARSAIAARRSRGTRKSRGGSKSGGGNGTATRSASPSAAAAAAETSGSTTNSTSMAIKSEVHAPQAPSLLAISSSAPAATPTPAAPIPTRLNLKRTRSTGPLGTTNPALDALYNLAAGGGAGAGAGSPLKAVHVPTDADADADADAAEDERKVKRLKSTAHLVAGTGAAGAAEQRTTRRKTHSPPSTHAPLLPAAGPVGASAASGSRSGSALGPDGPSGARSSPRSLSIGEGAAGSTAMRRVASAHVPSVRSRLGSTGPIDAAARERSKRETNLPRALRDYDTRAGVY